MGTLWRIILCREDGDAALPKLLGISCFVYFNGLPSNRLSHIYRTDIHHVFQISRNIADD